MRARGESLQSVKEKIAKLKGISVDMEVNRGRNRIVKLKAIIDQVYPSMFVIKPTGVSEIDRFSYSYGDLLCGDIRIKDLLKKDVEKPDVVNLKK